jgi:hypothetical protein
MEISFLTNLVELPHHFLTSDLLGMFDGSPLSDVSTHAMVSHSMVSHSIVIAQFKDTLGDDVNKVWNEFINTGRAWALLLGLVVGYLFSKLTSF